MKAGAGGQLLLLLRVGKEGRVLSRGETRQGWVLDTTWAAMRGVYYQSQAHSKTINI